MDSNALSKLSAEQLAAINDEQKAIYCSMDEQDQNFFAQTYKPKDLPMVLSRKGEIMKRNQARQERIESYQKIITESTSATPASNEKSEDVLTAIAGVVGIGAATAIIATDNSASWRGVKPGELVAPLRTEFSGVNSSVKVDGSPDALIVTVLLPSNSGMVPALTINLSTVGDGTEVKVSDLTSQGTLETLKEGGQKLLGLAGNALHILEEHRAGGASPEDLLSTANQTLSQGASLAETAGNLKLKDRAWKVIKQAAESIEASRLSELEKAHQAQDALEKAWDRYDACPTCGVAFGADDTECRVCGTARPEKPVTPDPRKK